MPKNKMVMAKEKLIDLDKRLFNEKYVPYLGVIRSYEIFYGGSGSGKSNFCGDLLALQMTTISGRNLVCLRAQKTDCLKSCFPEIRRGIKKLKLEEYWDIRESPQLVMKNRINGNQILFEGVDNIDDIKSIKFYSDLYEGEGNLTDVWYEEADAEPNDESIRELDRRLRDSEQQTRIILSFNPVSRQHWLFEFVERELRGISGNIVRTCYDTFSEDVLILHSTYKDNAFLPKSYGIKLEKLKYVKPYQYMVYAIGEWGVTGKTVFDSEKIAARLGKIGGMIYRTGYFTYSTTDNGMPIANTQTFHDAADGRIKIFKQAEKGRPYVVTVDTAGEGSDFYAAHVFDNITEEQVAVFRDPESPDECVRQCYFLACMYNDALICPEINFDTYIIKFLTMMDYPNIYRRVSKEDKRHVRKEDKLGWRTQPDNRQMMLTELVDWSNIPGNMDRINDVDTLNEMLTFTRQDKKNKGIWWGAESGANDDLIMSLAIFLQARVQQNSFISPDRKFLDGFYYMDELEDMLREGKITRFMMSEYIKNNNHITEKTGRRSRYA